jgi:hypothetical protein
MPEIRNDPEVMLEMPKKTRGDRFAEDVRKDFDLGDPVYELLLDEVAAVIDELDALAASATVERRMQRTLLSRLLSQLALPGPDDDASPKSVHARRAAEARWRRNVAHAAT